MSLSCSSIIHRIASRITGISGEQCSGGGGNIGGGSVVVKLWEMFTFKIYKTTVLLIE